MALKDLLGIVRSGYPATTPAERRAAVLELVRLEENMPGEERNRADCIIPEILNRYRVSSLADISEQDLNAFRYQANISCDSHLYRILLIRHFAAKEGLAVKTPCNY